MILSGELTGLLVTLLVTWLLAAGIDALTDFVGDVFAESTGTSYLEEWLDD